MTDHTWRTIDADGCTWQVRSLVNSPDTGAAPGQDVLEFAPAEGNRPARRLVIPSGSLHDMDETALRAAYTRARPIGGDHYGRPGKKMGDVREG